MIKVRTVQFKLRVNIDFKPALRINLGPQTVCKSGFLRRATEICGQVKVE